MAPASPARPPPTPNCCTSCEVCPDCAHAALEDCAGVFATCIAGGVTALGDFCPCFQPLLKCLTGYACPQSLINTIVSFCDGDACTAAQCAV